MSIRRIFIILNIYIIYLSNKIYCVNLNKCKIKNLFFITSKSYHLNRIAPKNYIYSNTSVKTDLFSEDSHNKSRNNLKYVDPNVSQLKDESLRKILEIDHRGTLNLKAPVKAVTFSLIPDILKVFQNRKKLGYGQVPTLLSCSGGVDSMSLLHCFGLIKQNYKHLVDNNYIIVMKNKTYPPNSNKDNENVSSKDKKKQIIDTKNDMINMFKELYENFNVVYFNHKQREDVDKDIEIINKACKIYDFNFIIKEIQYTDQVMIESKSIGLQNAFRLLRRSYCTKIVDELFQKNPELNGINNMYNNNNTNKKYNMKLDLDNIFDGELESMKRLKDLTNLKGLVFMAHHVDDNFETFLLKFLRGTFISNLTPMELYDSLDENSYLLIRPFINLSKPDLISFMDEINSNFNYDSSNSKLCYSRNIVRNILIPEISHSLTNYRKDERVEINKEMEKVVEKQQKIQEMKKFEGEKIQQEIKVVEGDKEEKKERLENKQEVKQDNLEVKEDNMDREVTSKMNYLLGGLDKKLNYLSKQCNNFNDLIVNEVDMFFDYINWKYNNIDKSNNTDNTSNKYKKINNDSNSDILYNRESWKGLEESEKDELRQVYRNFYENLYNNKYKELSNFEIQFNNIFNRLKKIGLKMDGYFYLKEWDIIPNKLIKEQTMNKFITDKLNKNILYRTLYGLVKILSKNIFSNQVKMYSVGPYLIYHQGYVLKIKDNINNKLQNKSNKKNNNTNNNRKLVHSDDKINIYNLLDNLNVEVNEDDNIYQDKFHLKFNIIPSTNVDIDNNDSNDNTSININDSIQKVYTDDINENNGEKEKLEIEIRYLNENDIVPFKRMWVNNAYKILTNIGVHRILKEEVPGIVLAGTNQVIGFYGFNCMPLHYPKGSQSLFYKTNLVDEPLKYNIRIS